MTAAFHVLTTGYADTRVAGTVTLLVDGETVAIADPGMVADRRLILDPLAHHGLNPEDVTDVIVSHHHPDHTCSTTPPPTTRTSHSGATSTAPTSSSGRPIPRTVTSG
ncbi:MBL fold metallo-hydrolase [Streptomyces mirabilis]|uniref:MBL fold metallo-hydrolase n=1 Tax=Streptomyces mirabilis TaxID=68239 RepID=UPI0036B46151